MTSADSTAPAGPSLDTAHGSVVLPTFLPDGTRASVRAVDTQDLTTVGIQAVMVNAMHLAQRPGLQTIRRAGGLHRFMAWDGVIVSDSGGFQVLSLIRKQGKTGAIRSNGVTFQESPTAKKIVLTPEKVIEWQFGLRSDVVVALDDCTGPEDSPAEQLASTERTIRWFRQARKAYDLQCRQRRSGEPPLLVGVVQGGTDPELRQRCVDALVESGAQGFGFGGWPLSAEGELEREMFALLSRITPPDAPLFALGVGRPEHLVSLCELDMRWVFDCTIPTRDARHGRLYSFVPEIADRLLTPDRSFYQNVYILDEENSRKDEPICATCDCPTCRRYSRSYLHHLFRVKDGLADRLATLHNLRFYTRLLEMIRAGRMARPGLGEPARVG
ncbi:MULTISPECIES: tRNA-ribosyltransferase family protein [Micromonospora]|uniref:Queuine tRNA-ribosyltransferase n=2 Tax=Micromonospora TaxID=1873 RepID=A0A1C6RDK3_9ACTN|nr:MULTISPECIES: tRNA guanosine(34) transglycosylase Tgt [Micromonospora]TWJ26597.1 queuine tRNA-ribosyltransferase [Micromonospora sagamiensis]BCL14518.1 tRNA-guanine transglycosylase [Micromonospora sagamiensis]SCL15219.1 queuine tRNA-ribosyltransferase [Micromonospora inyonensis]